MSDASDDSAGSALDAIEAQAAEWLGRSDRGLTNDETVAFARWREADPRHAAAVAELGAMWGAMDDLAALREPARIATENAAAAAAAPLPGSGRKHGKARGRGWMFALAACLVLGSALGIVWQRRGAGSGSAPVAERFETEIGAQRTVALADGSLLLLNTDSAVAVHYGAVERRLELLRGEAFFTVKKDAARSFVVVADGVEARALGTAFSVRRREDGIELIVAEGRVRFSAASSAASARDVKAGQLAMCDPRAPEVMRIGSLDDAALARALAWKAGRLVFRRDTPLAEAAAEFNRYHRRQLVLRSPEAGAMTVGGGFDLAKLDAFVRALESSGDVVVVERAADRIVLDVKR